MGLRQNEEKGRSYFESKYSTFELQELEETEVYQRLFINALIVDRTKRIIGNYLERWGIKSGNLDLSNTYLSGIKITQDLKSLTIKFDNAIVFDAFGNDPYSVFPVVDPKYSSAFKKLKESEIGFISNAFVLNPGRRPKIREDALENAIDKISQILGETFEESDSMAGDQLNFNTRTSLYLEWILYQLRLEKIEKDL